MAGFSDVQKTPSPEDDLSQGNLARRAMYLKKYGKGASDSDNPGNQLRGDSGKPSGRTKAELMIEAARQAARKAGQKPVNDNDADDK